MKVLHFIKTYLPVTCPWINDQIENSDNESIVACLELIDNNKIKYSNKIYDLSIDILNSSRYRYIFNFLPNLILLRRKMIDIIEKENINIIHCHFGVEGSILACAMLGYKIKIVNSFYGMDYELVGKIRYKILFLIAKLKVSRYITEGRNGVLKLINMGVSPEKIKTIAIGVESYKSKNRIQKFEKNHFTLTIACTFKEKKGIRFSLEALVNLNKEVTQKIRLLLIGEGELKDAFLDGIGNIEFLEVINKDYVSRSEFREYLNETDMFLHPSIEVDSIDSEGGIPVGLIEACMSECCVISTNICDIGDLVIPYETGIIVAQKNSVEIANAIEFGFNNPDLIKSMAKQARNHVLINYSLAKMNDNLSNLYKDVK